VRSTSARSWRIVLIDVWDRDALDLLGPAYIDITEEASGHFRFIAVTGDIDGRHVKREGCPAIELAGSAWMSVRKRRAEAGPSWRH
jgi:hypothetical protein